MVGILVFTSQKALNHKLRDGKLSDGNYCYWTTSRMPKEKVNRLYVAIKGQVKGYFKIKEEFSGELRFHSETWNTIEDGETLKPSQGWRYYPKLK